MNDLQLRVVVGDMRSGCFPSRVGDQWMVATTRRLGMSSHLLNLPAGATQARPRQCGWALAPCDSRRVMERARDAARRLGAEQIEPEHLLLALAEGHADPAARALAEAGLDGGAIEAAIEQDLVAALEVVGVPASVVASTRRIHEPIIPASACRPSGRSALIASSRDAV
jgi:hypothetical protein